MKNPHKTRKVHYISNTSFEAQRQLLLNVFMFFVISVGVRAAE